ncbi:Arabinogalactan peptide 20 [Dendrobium catenatum]|uniref:Arabinogalactan peptide 20 n=1 Tax=Dendrobium catenatum TaxID=906689 RepID=A0A2I0WIG0_9ASPA|nr:Arabinogalactan peptide 20 [Dendrobium catenatum]
MSSLKSSTMLLIAFFLSGLMERSHGEKTTMASSRLIDGKAIDQGIAYFLMLVALVVTFLVH